MVNESSDFSAMDDVEFLAERARVRDEVEHTPERAVSAELTARYQRLNEEFVHRARAAWAKTT